MKVVRGVSLFFIYSLVMLGAGFYVGVQATRVFSFGEKDGKFRLLGEQDVNREPYQAEPGGQDVLDMPEGYGAEADAGSAAEVKEVLAKPETLCADTEYVLKETNVLDHTVVEVSRRLPDKYVGMNREQFLTVMDTYESLPPLSEQERGFAGLEVLSFSRERVVVQMNYRYLEPSASFYLAAYDNMVWVYLEDKETVYIETEIRLDSLPQKLQRQIIQMMWVEDQRALYNFLESYSS